MVNDGKEQAAYKLVESYLRHNFVKPERNLLSRLLGEPCEYSYHIQLLPYEYKNLFHPWRLYWAVASESFLDYSYLPGKRSRGLFAVRESECLHLSSLRREPLGRLLEQVPALEEINPSFMAQLFCDAVASTKSHQFHIINQWSEMHSAWGLRRDLRLSSKLASEFENYFFMPNWRVSGNSLTLACYAISLSFSKVALMQIDFVIDAHHTIVIRQSELSPGILHKVPTRLREAL